MVRPRFHRRNTSCCTGVNTSNLVVVKTVQTRLSDSKIAVLNIRSLKRNILSVKCFLLEVCPDITFLSETWLQNDDIYPKRELCSLGYNMIRRDRNARGSGVALLFKNTLLHSTVQLGDYGSFEYVHALLSSGKESAHCICIYRPPKSSERTFLCKIEQLLLQTSSLGDPIFIAGDFNIHVDNNNNPFATNFTNMLLALRMNAVIRLIY